MDERKKSFLEALKGQFKGYDTEGEDLRKRAERRREASREKIYGKVQQQFDAAKKNYQLMSQEDYNKKWKKKQDEGS